MNQNWLYTLLSVFIISMISFAGVLFLSLRKQLLNSILMFFVSFSAGALLGAAFLHLLPNAVEESGFSVFLSLYVISGVVVFFVLEKIICWRHCHVPTSSEHPHPLAFLNLLGDAFHNFIDGMIIAGSFMVSVPLGVATSIAVIIHEIPQEIGDFGVLIYAGFSKSRALLFNFAAATAAFIGAIIVLSLSFEAKIVTSVLIPFTAGGFLYISGSDLIPEMKKENKLYTSFQQLAALLLGIFVMFALAVFE